MAGILEMLGFGKNQPQQGKGLMSAVAGMPKPSPVKEYFNTFVAPEELSSSGREKYYDAKTDSYRVYRVKDKEGKEEKLLTVGSGVLLNNLALKSLGLSKTPKEGDMLPASAVDAISLNRWGGALRRATRELSGTAGASSIHALAELIYQMGAGVVNPSNKQKYFRNTLKLLKEGKTEEAKEEAADSDWYRDTTSRAQRVISRFGKG